LNHKCTMAAASVWAPSPSQHSDFKGCLTQSSQPISPEFSDKPLSEHPLVVLRIPPRRILGKALHRRRNGWYLVWAGSPSMTSLRLVAMLNYPQDLDPPSTAKQPDGRHRFWFNPHGGHYRKLEYMLQADPPFIRLTEVENGE